MRNLIIVALVTMFSATTLAGPLIVTNTFSPDTTARASEVNQNFTDVGTAVDDNDSRIANNASAISANINALSAIVPPVFVLANGTPVGRFIGMGVNYKQVYMVNSNGYIYGIKNADDGGSVALGDLFRTSYSIYFQSGDCTGQPYARLNEVQSSAPVGLFAANNGNVFNMQGSIYYLPANSTSTNLSVSSCHTTSIQTACSSCPISDEEFYEVHPNNSLETGVSTTSFATPITLGQ